MALVCLHGVFCFLRCPGGGVSDPPPPGRGDIYIHTGGDGIKLIEHFRQRRLWKAEQERTRREISPDTVKDSEEYLKEAKERTTYNPERCMVCDMSLGKDILSKAINDGMIKVVFPDLEMDVGSIVKIRSYRALQRIKTVIDDTSLNDAECFQKIEAIIQIFEDNGGLCKRHDF